MVRTLSQLCYKALLMTSRLVIFIACSSLTITMVASCLLNDSQLDSFTNVIWFMTKILLYLSVTVGSFLLGAASKRIEEERHAAVLQAATRRKLSQRSTTLGRPAPASPPRTPPATLSLDTNIDSPPKRRSSRRLRGRSARLEFDSPVAPIPVARRLSMQDDEDGLQW
jgi:hypothetical protein